MSNKKYKYTDLSDTHKCRVCGKAIKKRLIEIKTVKPTLCYKHYIEQQGKLIKKKVKLLKVKAMDDLFEANQMLRKQAKQMLEKQMLRRKNK